MPFPAQFRFRLLAPALILVWSTSAAFAQELNPLNAGQEEARGSYWGATLGAAYDNNVTAQPGSAAVGSAIDSAGVTGRFDNSYDRQHVTASADVVRNMYLNFPLYDYTSEVLRADLKSNFQSNINTEIGVSRVQHLAEQQDLNTIRRDVLTTDSGQLAAYFPVAVDWHALVAGSAAWVDNSDVVDRPTNLDTKEGDVGVRYQRSLDNYIDLLGRYAHTTYPDAIVADALNPTYDDRGADLRTRWKFSGSSMLTGHAGYLQRRYTQLPFLDAAGPTYELAYTWTPGYKSELLLYALRQSGAAGDSGYLSGVTHTYRVAPTYLASSDVRLELYYQWSRLDYYGNDQAILTNQIPAPTTQAAAASIVATSRADTQYLFGFLLKWTPRRWLAVNLEAHRQARSSNMAEFDYEDRYTGVTVQLKI